MPFGIGPLELFVILFIVLIIFGAGKLPEIGGAMGKAIQAFRATQSGDDQTAAKSDTESGSKS